MSYRVEHHILPLPESEPCPPRTLLRKTVIQSEGEEHEHWRYDCLDCDFSTTSINGMSVHQATQKQQHNRRQRFIRLLRILLRV